MLPGQAASWVTSAVQRRGKIKRNKTSLFATSQTLREHIPVRPWGISDLLFWATSKTRRQRCISERHPLSVLIGKLG